MTLAGAACLPVNDLCLNAVIAQHLLQPGLAHGLPPCEAQHSCGISTATHHHNGMPGYRLPSRQAGPSNQHACYAQHLRMQAAQGGPLADLLLRRPC